MKNRFYKIGFFTLLGIILISAGTLPSLIKIEPKLPTKVMVETVSAQKAQELVYKFVRQGYKVHTVTAPNEFSRVMVVMEKY